MIICTLILIAHYCINVITHISCVITSKHKNQGRGDLKLNCYLRLFSLNYILHHVVKLYCA